MARTRNIKMYAPGQGVLGGQAAIRRDYAEDPRRLMGEELMEAGGSMAPVSSNLEGMARALSGVAGGYFAGQARDKYRERESELSEDMNTAFAGGNAQPWVDPDTGVANPKQAPTGGYAGMGVALGKLDNPDLNSMRQQVGMGQMQERRAMETAARERAQGLVDFEKKAMITAKHKKLAGGGATSNMRDYAELVRLKEMHGEESPQVKQFIDFVRATRYMDAGGEIKKMSPIGPAETVATKTLPPAKQPENIAKATTAKAVATNDAENAVAFKNMNSTLPKLRTAVERLKKLGETASYSAAGQLYNYGREQIGMDPSEGAVSRVKYVSSVKNIILPLLRETFGAAFTAAEGESLLETLGDPDQSSELKNAALDSFMVNKEAEVRRLWSLTRDTPPPFQRAGETSAPAAPAAAPPAAAAAAAAAPSEEDIRATMAANNMTRDQVMQRLAEQNGR